MSCLLAGSQELCSHWLVPCLAYLWHPFLVGLWSSFFSHTPLYGGSTFVYLRFSSWLFRLQLHSSVGWWHSSELSCHCLKFLSHCVLKNPIMRILQLLTVHIMSHAQRNKNLSNRQQQWSPHLPLMTVEKTSVCERSGHFCVSLFLLWPEPEEKLMLQNCHGDFMVVSKWHTEPNWLSNSYTSI